MKFNRWFITFVVVFLALVFVMEYQMPRRFSWNPSFSHIDKQPFGCYVFDSVLSASLSDGYEVTKKTLYQLRGEHRRMGVLVVAEYLYNMSETDVDNLLAMAAEGSKILLVSGGMPSCLSDTLHFDTDGYYHELTLREYAMRGLTLDTVTWIADAVYDRKEYYLYPQLSSFEILLDTDSVKGRILAMNTSHQHVEKNDSVSHSTAVSIPVGKGEVILGMTPLAFTNYGIMEGNIHDYVFRLLTQMKGLPMVRTEAYTPATAQEEQSPLRYFLAQPPLRWAVTLAFFSILVFMVFTAKRRQRVIPEVEKPKNRNLEFVKLIGTLYYQKHDYRDLVLKKSAYFTEEMRRVLHVDLTDRSEDLRTFSVIASQTGMEEQEVARLVNTLRQLEDDEELDVGRTTMESLINQISTIWKKTNQEPTSPSSQRR